MESAFVEGASKLSSLAASPEHAAIEVWDGAAQLCCLSAEPIELPAAA